MSSAQVQVIGRHFCPIMLRFLLVVVALSQLGLSAAMSIRITTSGTSNAALSEPLRAYADLKLGKSISRHSDLLRTDIELLMKVETHSRHDNEHHGVQAHIAEVTAYCKDKHIIHCAAQCDNMYASLDELSDTLGRKLRKYKERKATNIQERRRESKLDLRDSLVLLVALILHMG